MSKQLSRPRLNYVKQQLADLLKKLPTDFPSRLKASDYVSDKRSNCAKLSNDLGRCCQGYDALHSKESLFARRGERGSLNQACPSIRMDYYLYYLLSSSTLCTMSLLKLFQNSFLQPLRFRGGGSSDSFRLQGFLSNSSLSTLSRTLYKLSFILLVIQSRRSNLFRNSKVTLGSGLTMCCFSMISSSLPKRVLKARERKGFSSRCDADAFYEDMMTSSNCSLRDCSGEKELLCISELFLFILIRNELSNTRLQASHPRLQTPRILKIEVMPPTDPSSVVANSHLKCPKEKIGHLEYTNQRILLGWCNLRTCFQLQFTRTRRTGISYFLYFMRGQRRDSSPGRDRKSLQARKPLIKTPSSKRFPKDFFEQAHTPISNAKFSTKASLSINVSNKEGSQENQFTFRADKHSDCDVKSKENEQNQYPLSQVVLVPLMKKANSLNEKLLSNQTRGIRRVGMLVHRSSIRE